MIAVHEQSANWNGSMILEKLQNVMAVTDGSCRSSHLKQPERGQIVTEQEDLKKRYAAAAELRSKKVDEIRELLAIPPGPGDQEAVKLIAGWRETGQVCVPAEQKTKTQRLLREWQCIHIAVHRNTGRIGAIR
jgi:hypothetical protein